MPEVVSELHVHPVLSSVLIDGVGTAGFACMLVVALVRRRSKLRQGREADACVRNDTRLEPGSTVLQGTVERAEAATTTVRVEVDQVGEESESSGTWSHKWTEKDRRVIVEPFYMRLANGQRIRVEPNAEVCLVDAMDGMIRVDLMRRTRYAELTPGERVYAAGMLVQAPDPEGMPDGRGYRAPRVSLVLRPPPGAKMLLSSEPLGDRFRERAAFHRGWAWWILFAAFMLHTVFMGYHARRYLGIDTTAKITKLDHFTTKDDEGDEVDHYRVWMDPFGGSLVSDEVSSNTFAGLHEGDVVPVTVVPGAFATFTAIGPPGTALGFAWLAIPYLLVWWAHYRSREGATRPWYERRIEDLGSGKLEEGFKKEPPT
jgi:hypothetical protein